jgi:hypothetical protein
MRIVPSVISSITVYLLLVHTEPRPSSGLYPRTGPPLTGAQFGAVLTAIGLWQVIFYVAFRGWPFAGLTNRALRLAAANITTTAAGISTYLILHAAIALGPPIASAVAGSALTAVLVCGMLFDGFAQAAAHASRERLIIVGAIVGLAAALYAALTAIAHQGNWSSASPAEWVTYASLNAIGLGIILHVAIGRRWPFVREAGHTTR